VPSLTLAAPAALFESFFPGPEGRSFRFEGLQRVLVAELPEEVVALLAEVEAAVATGHHAAGFVSYAAATGLDPALPAHPRGALPLVWFGIFAKRVAVEPGTTTVPGTCRLLVPEPSWDEADYAAAFATVKEYIAAGDSYQVNLTFRESFRFTGEPFVLYRQLCAAQPAAFCAWLKFGDVAIASASPELFFARRGNAITMRPMKGTSPRGIDDAADLRWHEQLAASPKERAENLMIVDLVRNDLGRIAETGSVQVPALFAVESYPTLHQMTSTVTARLREGTGLVDIFRALFPCGSVTGAPKRRSMAIINELEDGSRGLYCGALGFVSPGGEAVFSVAIRTAVLDLRRGVGEMGVGSGVTADAEAGAEYRESLSKVAFVAGAAEPLSLIETLLWDSGRGYVLLERHLRRLATSAAALGFCCAMDQVRQRLLAVTPVGGGRHKVRLLLAIDGNVTVTTEALVPRTCLSPPARVVLAAKPIDSREPLLHYKTSWRPWYDGALEGHPGVIDVLFCNSRGEVTEGTSHNLVMEKDGRLVTPVVDCGLLPGTLRQELLDRGVLTEEVILKEDLFAARRLWLINSVRGWLRVALVP
jgi:para-aminobenzoate synthetase/4-amino-4-deoxychorismate lyase